MSTKFLLFSPDQIDYLFDRSPDQSCFFGQQIPPDANCNPVFHVNPIPHGRRD